MGFFITDNFKTPYLSKNIGEFWHRWHISLSSWFKDYVYIPLGGSRVSIPKWMLNIMVVFLLSGLWHGANWTFVLWGGAYGVILIFEKLFGKHFVRQDSSNKIIEFLSKGFAILKNFVLVTFIWVLFRAQNFVELKTLIKSIFKNIDLKDSFHVDAKVWIFLAFFIVLDVLIRKSRFDVWCANQKIAIRWILYAILIFSIIVFASVNNFPFIYFQF